MFSAVSLTDEKLTVHVIQPPCGAAGRQNVRCVLM